MAERVKDDQLPQRLIPPTNPSGESKRLQAPTGEYLRIDGAHVPPMELATREVEWQELERATPARKPDTAHVPDDSESMTSDTSLLDEFTQHIRRRDAQIQAQKANLVQREQALQAQQAALENEHKQITHQLTVEHAQLDAKKNQLQKENAAFAKRLIEFEIQSKKFDDDYQIFQQHRSELDRQKKSLRDDLMLELQTERKELEQSKSAFQKEVDQVEALNDALQTRLESLADENARTLKSDREKLWQSLTEEWQQRQTAFQREQEEWTKTRDLERIDIDREKAMFESAVESANKEFLSSREALAVELAELRQQQVKQLDVERQKWETQRLQAQAELFSQAEAQKAELARSKEALVREFDQFREELATSARTDREEWEAIRGREASELLSLRTAIETEINELRERHIASMLAERTEWEEARNSEQALIAKEKSELDDLKVALEREFLASREEHAGSIREAQEAWEQQRDREDAILSDQHAKLIEACEQLKLELFDLRAQHDSQIAAERAEWEQTRERQTAEYDDQKSAWLASRDSMLQASRDALEVEFIGLREQHSTRLHAERDEWQQTLSRESALLEERRAEVLRERTLIENRIRFQQDHLDKSRIELEQAQNDYRRERQIERQRLVDANLLMIRRLKQIDLYRSSIDAREKSLDREHEVFSRTRKAISSTADLDRLNLQAEKHAWEQERQIQQQELRRQQEVLATRAEGLESRRTRLDKLRAELEETHRTTLEMRLAVEEAWAQFSHGAGQDDARQRVEQVRQSLMGYYQQMHESIGEQRREHMDAQSKFERLRAEFADERQKLTSWLTARDEELRLGEDRLRIASGDAAENHAKWLAARDQWLVEKTEAEHLIRRLLTSLGDNTRDQSVDPELLLGLDEINGYRDDAFSKLRADGTN